MILDVEQYLAFQLSSVDKDKLLLELEDFQDFEIPKDERAGSSVWQRLELLVQKGAFKKDPNTGFRLPSRYKEYVKDYNGFKIYNVNGPWIHNNLSVIFGHGGHGFVHEFIPHGEIWMAKTHHNCLCQANFPDEPEGHPLSQGYFDSTVLHETTECKLMSLGLIYWAAHNISLEAERRGGFRYDPGEQM